MDEKRSQDGKREAEADSSEPMASAHSTPRDFSDTSVSKNLPKTPEEVVDGSDKDFLSGGASGGYVTPQTDDEAGNAGSGIATGAFDLFKSFFSPAHQQDGNEQPNKARQSVLRGHGPEPVLVFPSTCIYFSTRVDPVIAHLLTQTERRAVCVLKRFLSSIPLRLSETDSAGRPNSVNNEHGNKTTKRTAKKDDAPSPVASPGSSPCRATPRLTPVASVAEVRSTSSPLHPSAATASTQLSTSPLSPALKEKAYLSCLTLEDVLWCTDQTVVRFLNSYSWQIPVAATMLQKTLEWRRMRRPDQINPQDVEAQMRSGKMYRKGFDRRGNAVMYFRPRHETTQETQEIVDIVLYTMERALQSMGEIDKKASRADTAKDHTEKGPPKVGQSAAAGGESTRRLYYQLAFVLDFNGWQFSQMPPLEAPKEIVRILTDNYTDILFKAYILDPPGFFNGLWQIVKLGVHPDTAKKVRILSTSNAEDVRELEAAFPCEVLESCGTMRVTDSEVTVVPEAHLQVAGQQHSTASPNATTQNCSPSGSTQWYDHVTYWPHEETQFIDYQMYKRKALAKAERHPRILQKLNESLKRLQQ